MPNITYDITGKIINQHATFDEDGQELTPATYVEGFHVNTTEPVEGWEQYRVVPKTPVRVYAGNIQPICYQFDSQEQFIELSGLGQESEEEV